MPDEFVEADRVTPRFRAAIARAALALVRSGADGADLRVPVARAVLELAPDLDDDAIAALVAKLTPIAARDLG
jgi:hypothetical protein